MISGREITPPPGFLAAPTTTTMFAATTPENTPLSYRASTSTNPNPVISPAFVEANYETLESLLRDRRRHMCNSDLRTELEYFSEDYNEEREMEPRPEPVRVASPPLRAAGESRVERNNEGGRPLEEASRGNGSQNVNLPPLLAAHIGRSENGQPFQSSLTSVYKGQALPNKVGGNLPPNVDYPLPDGLKMPSHISSYDGKGDPDNFLHLFEGAIRMHKWLMPVACHMFTYTLKDSARIWWNSQKAGSILDYEDLKAKFRSHFSQQKKFTKTNLAVHNIKQRENESTQAFITRYTDDTLQILGLHKDERISDFIHGLRTRSLVEHLSIDLPPTYKGLMEKTYTWVEAREVATNGVSSDRRDSFERSKKSFWDNNRGQKNKDRFSPYRGPNHSLLSNLSKSPREILATKSRKKLRTTSQDVRKQTIMRYLQIQEAINSGQLSHLVKGIKKEKAKSTDTPRGEGKKDKSIAPVEAPILMISREDYAAKNTVSESMAYKEEITFPPVTRVSNAPVIIEAAVFRRKVGRVYMDSGSTCEVIYEHCFEKLNPTIKATRVNTKTPLVGFSGKRSWSVGEVPLEITIGEHPLSRTETLNFVIVKSDSPHNMLLGRTAMQKMGIVVSTIHGAIKFHTKKESEPYSRLAKLGKK
ncbi:reverse transcriptase domain-containing protein [Tanacetum coccineum]